ncbi:unnamed protein product, partial [Gadus morhua 'NCC']
KTEMPFVDRSTQRGATSKILAVVAPGSSHWSSHKVEALNSLSADHSVAKSLERGERLVCHEELSVQLGNHLLIQHPNERLPLSQPQHTPIESTLLYDLISHDGNDIRDCSTQRGDTSESLGVDAPGSSHMASHNGELRILSVYGKGEGPLAVDGWWMVFPNNANMIVHMWTRPDERPYGCGQRKKRFIREFVPTAHEKMSYDRVSSARIVSFTDDCFLNLVQYKAGLAEHLEMESGSVPTLLGSATNLGQQTSDTISIKVEEDIGGGMPAGEDCDAFGDRSTQRGATSESLGVDGPGSSHMSSHSGELKILSVYGKGEGPLAVDGHDTLFTASEVEALNSLSADHSAAKSLERGERLVCSEELSVQQTLDTISIKVEEDIGGGIPAVEDCDAFGDRSTQRGATSESLGMDVPGSYHMSSHSGELKILSVYGKGEGPLAVEGHDTLFTASEVEALNSLSADHSAAKSLERGERLVCSEELSVQQQTPDTISIKVEEDIGGGIPAVEDGNDIRDRSTQRGATSESLGVDAPGSSHMASHNGELQILSVYGKGEGPLAVDGHDTLFTTSEVEALSSLSADCSVAKSLNCSVRLVRLEELTGHRGGRKGRPGVLCGKASPSIGNIQVFLSRDVACHTDHLETHTVATRLSLKTFRPHFTSKEDCDAFGDRSTQRGATSESLGVDAPGSSHMSSHEVEALNSLSADHSAAKSLERGERLVCHEELSVQQTPDTISIKVEEDIGGGMPAVEDCDAFGDRSTQRGATSESLGMDVPGSYHMSSHSGELKILSVYEVHAQSER